jgi:dTDP-4-dehydrorhamnose 3,5-epimerase
MKYTPLQIPGVLLLEVEPHTDERGLFARTVCSEEFSARGLPSAYPQSSTSFNKTRGTLRGMHFQISPSQESKLVRCDLSAENRRSLAIPHGCAHGFMTLEDASEVLYMMSEQHRPELARGVRWNDPAFGIVWPLQPTVLSDRDAAYPDFTQELLNG